MEFKVHSVPPSAIRRLGPAAPGLGPGARRPQPMPSCCEAQQLREADDLQQRRARIVRRDRRRTRRRRRSSCRIIRKPTEPAELSHVRQADLGRDPLPRADPADHLDRRDPRARRNCCVDHLDQGLVAISCGTSTSRPPTTRRSASCTSCLACVMLVRGFADAIMMRAQQYARGRRVAGISAAGALQPDLLRPRHDHDLLRGDAAGHRLHELRRAAAARRPRRRFPDDEQRQLLADCVGRTS